MPGSPSRQRMSRNPGQVEAAVATTTAPGPPPECAALVEPIVRGAMLDGESIRLDGAIRMAPR